MVRAKRPLKDHHLRVNGPGVATFTRFLGLTALLFVVFLFVNFTMQLQEVDIDDGQEMMNKFLSWEKENEKKRLRKRKKAESEARKKQLSNSDDDNKDLEDVEGVGQKYQGDKVLPWTNPFSIYKRRKSSFIDSDKSEDEQLEENLNEQIAEWLIETERTSELEDLEKLLQQQQPITERLTKRQRFIDKQFAKENSIPIGPLRQYVYKMSKLSAKLPDELREDIAKRSAVPLPEFQTKTRAASRYAILNAKTASTQAGNAAIIKILDNVGYHPKAPGEAGPVLPLILLSYGTRCVKSSVLRTKSTDEHFVFCAHAFLPPGLFYPYLYRGKLLNLDLNNDDFVGRVNSFWMSKNLRKTYRLFVPEENERARQEPTSDKATWTVVPKNGTGTPQIATNVESVATKYNAVAHGCYIHQNSASPVLWANRIFRIRAWLVVTTMSPLKIFFGGAHAVKSLVDYVPYGTGQTAQLSAADKKSMYSPHLTQNPELLSLSKLAAAFPGLDVALLKKKLKEYSTYTIAGILPKRRRKAQQDFIAISHVCFDFELTDIATAELVLENGASDCKLSTKKPVMTGIIAAETELHGAIKFSSVPELDPVILEGENMYIQ